MINALSDPQLRAIDLYFKSPFLKHILLMADALQPLLGKYEEELTQKDSDKVRVFAFRDFICNFMSTHDLSEKYKKSVPTISTWILSIYQELYYLDMSGDKSLNRFLPTIAPFALKMEKKRLLRWDDELASNVKMREEKIYLDRWREEERTRVLIANQMKLLARALAWKEELQKEKGAYTDTQMRQVNEIIRDLKESLHFDESLAL